MPLVAVKQLLDDATQSGYAVPAIDCVNLETIEATIECAGEEGSGVIVQFHPEFFQFAGIAPLTAIVRTLSFGSSIPVALSLDHGATREDILLALRHGFTGVMLDASAFSLRENIARVREAVALCHPLGVTVEAALGHMPAGRPQGVDDLADADEAVALMSESGADVLAAAVGSVHGAGHGGAEKVPPRLAIDHIARLARRTGKPLCLHGGSAISERDLNPAIAAGIRKVVFYSDMARAFNSALRDTLAETGSGRSIAEVLHPAREAFKSVVREKIRAVRASQHYAAVGR